MAGPLPDWCYELAWTPQPLSAEVVEATALEPGGWLIFDSHDGLGVELAERLRMKGHDCAVVPPGMSPESRRTAVEEFLAAPGGHAGPVAEAGSREQGVGRKTYVAPRSPLPAPRFHGIVYLAGVDVGGNQETPDFAAARRDGWGAVLDLVHAVTLSGVAKPPRLWLVTRGANAAGNASPLTLAQSPIWGLGRVIAAEYPELGCSRIDLDPKHQRDEADQLAEELWSGQSEDQVAFREGDRLTARLRRLDHVEPGACRFHAAGPTGWRSPRGPVGQRRLAAGRASSRQGRARSKSRSTPRGSISAMCSMS